MKKKILSFAAIAMLFAACSSDEPNPPPDAENIMETISIIVYGDGEAKAMDISIGKMVSQEIR